MSESAQETVTPTEARLNAARATIAKLEKRIVELEDELAHANGVAMGMAVALNQTKQALAAERKRREEAESILPLCLDGRYITQMVMKVRKYFLRYPSESDNRTKGAGDNL